MSPRKRVQSPLTPEWILAGGGQFIEIILIQGENARYTHFQNITELSNIIPNTLNSKIIDFFFNELLVLVNLKPPF